MLHVSHRAGAALLLLPVVFSGCARAPAPLGEPVLVRVQREGRPEQELRVALSQPHAAAPLVPEVVRAFTQAQTQCASESARTSIDGTFRWAATAWELVPAQAPPGCMELTFASVVPKLPGPLPAGTQLRLLGGVADGPLTPPPSGAPAP